MAERDSNNSEMDQHGTDGTTLITTIARAKINALAYQGIIPSDYYSQIIETIKRSIGEKHAMLFAEPVANKNEGFIDWYSKYQGNVRNLTELPLEEANAAIAKIIDLAKAINAFAESLIQTQDPQKVTRGNLLRCAL